MIKMKRRAFAFSFAYSLPRNLHTMDGRRMVIESSAWHDTMPRPQATHALNSMPLGPLCKDAAIVPASGLSIKN
ncbi:unnamed protein product, partial [Iphiclides podalirius]